MSTLRSGLEELETTGLRFVSDQELEGILGEIDRAMGVLEVVRSRAVAEVERRGSFANDGHLSITSWVEHRFRTGWAEAAQQVRMARALEEMPATRQALSEGDVSRAAVGQLVAAREANPEEFFRVEDVLVDAARNLSVRDLKRAVSHWREVVDTEAPARDAEQRFERRRLHVSSTFEGMVRVDGD